MRRGTPAGCAGDAEEIVPAVISAVVAIASRPWLVDAWPLFAHGGAPVMPWWGLAVCAFIVERLGSSIDRSRGCWRRRDCTSRPLTAVSAMPTSWAGLDRRVAVMTTSLNWRVRRANAGSAGPLLWKVLTRWVWARSGPSRARAIRPATVRPASIRARRHENCSYHGLLCVATRLSELADARRMVSCVMRLLSAPVGRARRQFGPLPCACGRRSSEALSRMSPRLRARSSPAAPFCRGRGAAPLASVSPLTDQPQLAQSKELGIAATWRR